MRSFPVKSPSRERVLRADFSEFFFLPRASISVAQPFPGYRIEVLVAGASNSEAATALSIERGARKERALRIPLPPVTEGGTPASGRAWAGLAGSESKRTGERERRRGRRPGRCGDGKTERDRQTERERERKERECVCRCARE